MRIVYIEKYNICQPELIKIKSQMNKLRFRDTLNFVLPVNEKYYCKAFQSVWDAWLTWIQSKGNDWEKCNTLNRNLEFTYFVISILKSVIIHIFCLRNQLYFLNFYIAQTFSTDRVRNTCYIQWKRYLIFICFSSIYKWLE